MRVLVATLTSFVAVTPAAGGGTHALFARGARGVDISYPNCRVQLTALHGFAVVGVNGGHPFSFNPCLRREYGRFSDSAVAALYLNTGYEPWYPRAVLPECVSAAGGRGIAYAVGCSEAATSVRHLATLGLRQPRMWWLDVEPSNMWSYRRGVNTSVLRGMLDYLKRSTHASVVGIYSMRRWWQEISGWRTSVPEWIPSAGEACPAPFSMGRVLLAQRGSRGLDIDVAC